MARFVKLMKVVVFSNTTKDREIYVNPEKVQIIEFDGTFKIVGLIMDGTCVRVRGEFDEIVNRLSSTNKRIY